MQNKKQGFTLMEMLIVVAIIAILVAIAIPIFTGRLEKAREAVDLANIRSAYAEVMISALDEPDNETSLTVELAQSKDDWQTDSAQGTLEQLGNVDGTPTADGSCEVKWAPADQKVSFIFDGSGGNGNQTPNYDLGNSRTSRLSTMARAISDIMADADPYIARSYLAWGVIAETGYVFNGEHVTVTYLEKCLSPGYISSLNADKTYYDQNSKPQTYNVANMLTDKGVDLSGFSNADFVGNSAHIYFDTTTYQPIAVSHFENGNSGTYLITYLDNGKTYQTNGANYRQYYVYNRDYTEQNLAEYHGNQ